MTEGVASTTVFSLCADPPASLPSEFQGGNALLDRGWLAGEDARDPVHVRRFSAAGATLRLAGPVSAGIARTLELQNGQVIDGRIEWANDVEAGFVFDAPMDVVSTLARNLAILPAERRRVPRVELHHAVGIRHADQFEISRTRDLSQAGLGIETRLALEPEDVVQVALDGLRPLQGVVKWSREGKAGIAFDTELGWQTLMPWLRQAQKSTAWRATLPHGIDDGRAFLAHDATALRIDTPGRVREGVRWWNVQVRMITATMVEFDSGAAFAPGTQLWVWLPGTAGWPAGIVESENGRYLAEFRLPLRKHDLDIVAPQRIARNA